MTAKIKLNAASGGGSVSIQAPSSSSNNRVISLPDIADGTLLTSSSSVGVTEADLFQLTADVTVSGDTDLSTNWARPNTANDGFGKLGTGMSFSGATWTFPSTGIYLIGFNVMIYANGNNGTTQSQILATENNSTYGLQSTQHNSVTNGEFGSVHPQALIDVTNTSNVKVKFRVTSSASNQLVGSNTAVGMTYVSFIRLGDT